MHHIPLLELDGIWRDTMPVGMAAQPPSSQLAFVREVERRALVAGKRHGRRSRDNGGAGYNEADRYGL